MNKRLCELTSAGRGAICVLRVQSDQVAELVGPRFRHPSGRPLANLPLDRPLFGTWQAKPDPATSVADAGEEVVVWQRSATDLEIQCHGGWFARQRIVSGLQELGFESTSREDDPWFAEGQGIARQAELELAHALTVKTAAVLQWQVRGALDQALQDLDRRLQDPGQGTAESLIRELQQWAPLGDRLVQPWRVLVSGPANVGKSSLINRLLGYHRSIVFDQPGTTRDLVSALTAVEGWPVELLDSAGIRESATGIEQAGIRLAEAAARQVDLVLQLREADPEPPPGDPSTGSVPVLTVVNKIDLLETDRSWPDGWLPVSARLGTGISRIPAAIRDTLIPREPVSGQAIPFRGEHRQWLELIAAAMARGERALARDLLQQFQAGRQPVQN